MTNRQRLSVIVAGVAACLVFVDVGAGVGADGADRRMKVLTTVAPITDIVRHVGAGRIRLHGLVPDGVDSHTFEPVPSDIRFIAEADLTVLNGLHLETPTEKLVAANKKAGAKILKLGDRTITRKDWIFDFSFPEDQGDPNPHLWLNVAYAMRYAELVRDALAQADPVNAPAYRQAAEQYLITLKRLDETIFTAVQTIPPANRKLLTYHDSWAYFARRYGMTVIGAIQPADFAEPAPRDVARLIDQLKRERVPAIFGSEVFPNKVLDQIGREAKVRFIETLRDDDLPGEAGSPWHTYVGMIVEDVQTMVTALGGRAAGLEEIVAGASGQHEQ